MADKVQKIREEVIKIVNSINLFTPDEDGKNSSYEAGKLDVASEILQVIDSLQEELVSDEQVEESLISKHVNKVCKENDDSLTRESVSVWHDKNEEPDEDRQVLINLSDFCYVDFFHKKDRRFYMFGNPKHYLHEVDKWAYIDDLINNPKKEECEFKPTISVWHKANDEKPIKGRKVVVLTGVSNVSDKDIAFAGEYIGGMYVQTYSCKEYMNSWAIWAYIEDMAHEDKRVQVDKAMAEVEEKAKAFTEAHKGESSEQLLAEMRGEDSVSEDFEIALKKKVREAQGWTYIEEEGGECPLNEEFGADDLEEFAMWGADWVRNNKKEPVSEDLEEEIGKYCSNPENFITYIDGGFKQSPIEKDDIPLIIKAIKFGAKWQLNKIRKKYEENRD